MLHTVYGSTSVRKPSRGHTSWRRLSLIVLVLAIGSFGVARADESPTLFILEGVFQQETDYTYSVMVSTQDSRTLNVTIPTVQSLDQPLHAQIAQSEVFTGEPAFDDRWEETDLSGNTWTTLVWYHPPDKLVAKREVRIVEETRYGPIYTSAPFPVESIDLPWEAFNSLWASTPQIQSTNSEIRELALSLVQGCRLELEAVVRILNWVRANVRYTCSRDSCSPVSKADALFTLQNKKGNCLNFANLTVALLRAAGIPAQRVFGFVADREDSKAGHCWMAAYFPDLGWVEFETGNWMPTRREVPITFLTPRHITIYRGEGKGITRGDFTELHEAQFTITAHPVERTSVLVNVQPGQAVHWVCTLQNPRWEKKTFSIRLDDVPAGWYASLSETTVTIDPNGPGNGPGNSWDFLLTVVPPSDALIGEKATLLLSAISENELIGRLTVTVTVVEQAPV